MVRLFLVNKKYYKIFEVSKYCKESSYFLSGLEMALSDIEVVLE